MTPPAHAEKVSGSLETDLQILATNRLLEALVESENRMRQRVNLLREVVFELDGNGRIVFLNSAWTRLMGGDAQPLVGTTLSDWILPEDRPTYAAVLSDTAANDHAARPVVRVLHPQGAILWMELSAVARPGNGHIGTLHDVTDQKRDREELELLSLVANATDNFVVITDADGKIEWGNASFLRKTGYRLDEIRGLSPGSFLQGPGTDPQEVARIGLERRAGRSYQSKILNYTRSGQSYWTTMHVNPIFAADGRVQRFIAVQSDTTALHNVQTELAQAVARELATGMEIQRVLLLGEVPEGIDGAHIATQSEPSKGIDGDFLIFNRYSDTCFDLLVGDVMGKGVPAALIGAGIKNTYYKVLATLLASHRGEQCLPQPAAIINALHEAMTPRLVALDAFVTLALYRFDLDRSTLTFVNAGHTPGLASHARDGRFDAILGNNLPIGVLATEVYLQSSIRIGPGDVFLAYSDGITEAQNAQMQPYGDDRLRQLLQTSQDRGLHPSVALEALRHDLGQFTGSRTPSDDRTAVMIRLADRAARQRESGARRGAAEWFTFKWDIGALGEFRARIGSAAGSLSEEEQTALQLAAFEAASNVVRHVPRPHPDATFCCGIEIADATVCVELTYAGKPFTPPPELKVDFSGATEGGFGLYIIEQSVDAVEYGSPMRGICSIRLTKRASHRHVGAPPSHWQAHGRSESAAGQGPLSGGRASEQG